MFQFLFTFFFLSLNLIHVHSNSENTLDFMRRAYILVTHTRVYELFFFSFWFSATCTTKHCSYWHRLNWNWFCAVCYGAHSAWLFITVQVYLRFVWQKKNEHLESEISNISNSKTSNHTRCRLEWVYVLVAIFVWYTQWNVCKSYEYNIWTLFGEFW